MTEYRVGRWAPSTSLRAQRSNPCRHKESMDCFVARAPRNDEETAESTHSLPAAATKSYRCSGRGKLPPPHLVTTVANQLAPARKKPFASDSTHTSLSDSA